MNATASGPARSRSSLRNRGLLVFAAIILYSGFLSMYALGQKEQLLDRFFALQELHAQEGVVRQADLAAFHGMAELFISIDANDQASRERLRAHVFGLQRRHAEFVRKFPDAGPAFATLGESIGRIVAEPSPVRLLELRKQVDEARRELIRLADHMRSRQEELSAEYRRLGNRAAITSLMLGLIGVIVIGAMTGVFFTRLTADLRTLQEQARRIVAGDRDLPVVVQREDEVGELAHAIHTMSSELARREQELAIERQASFHSEKMAAIGNLAAGIVHEIGNPIAAISGLVQDLRDNPEQPVTEEQRGSLDLILSHTDRLASIARDVSEFGAPHSVDKQLIDLNALVGTTSRLLRHDKRFRSIEVALELDLQLPAVPAVGDQLIQVLMNLLVNAADACEGIGRTPRVVVRTRQDHGRVLLEVEDNGQGMDEATRTHALEAFFSTKPPGKGTGLGLAMCYSIITDHGGSIDLQSRVGAGTMVTVALTLADAV